ncbi:MAG: protease protein, partial [uncultured bacterium]
MIDLFLSGVLLAKTAATTPSATVESLGMQHSTYQQSYNDVPVFGGDIKIHTNLKSGERFATGQLVENVTLDTVPTITADEAVSAAQQIANRPEASTRSTTLYIFNEHILNKLKPDENVLVWRVDLFQDQPIFHEYYFINASTGELVYQITGVYSAINRLIYDCSYGIVTGDCYYDATDFYYTGYIYGRSEGQPARGPNPQNPNFFVTSLNDTDNLYDTLGSVYNYYLATYTLDGANGHGGMGDGSATFPTTTTT